MAQSTPVVSSPIQSASKNGGSNKRTASESLDSEEEDSFKESKKAHTEIALVSYCSESEYIKPKEEAIVYDYHVLTLMYISFQLTHCYGRIFRYSFTTDEEEIPLNMMILHN